MVTRCDCGHEQDAHDVSGDADAERAYGPGALKCRDCECLAFSEADDGAPCIVCGAPIDENGAGHDDGCAVADDNTEEAR